MKSQEDKNKKKLVSSIHSEHLRYINNPILLQNNGQLLHINNVITKMVEKVLL